MIKNYKQYNEGIKHLLVGPTDEVVLNYLNNELGLNVDKIPETPKGFLLYMFDGIKIFDYDKNIYVGNAIYWEKNDNLLLEQQPDNLTFFVSYPYIWKILENLYGLSRIEIEKILTDVVQNDLGWDGYHMLNAVHKWFYPDVLRRNIRTR